MKRLLFCVKAIHALVEAGEVLDEDELAGLKEILETVVIEFRGRTK